MRCYAQSQIGPARTGYSVVMYGALGRRLDQLSVMRARARALYVRYELRALLCTVGERELQDRSDLYSYYAIDISESDREPVRHIILD